MRYPAFITPGDTIGFPSPSFSAASEPYRTCFNHALKVLEGKGYNVKPGPYAYADEGIGICSTPENCGREFTEMYCSSDTTALISCGGGELACQTLANADMEAIAAAEPKWFEGYSDNTNFTFTLTTLCDVASIYGPCAASFGMEPWHESIDDAFNTFTGGAVARDDEGIDHIVVSGYPLYEVEGFDDGVNPLAPYNCTEPTVRRVFSDGEMHIGDGNVSMEGRLIGGCLDLLTILVGTKFDNVAEFNERYADDGIIWFVESCDLSPMQIRRAFWQMENAGWFSAARGFIIGRPAWGSDPFMNLDAYDAAIGILEKYNVPIIMDADIGHVPPAMPLICGSYAKITCEGNDISIDQALR